MASRVNTTFVVVLCAGLILLVGGFAAAYMFLINKSAAQYEALGDDLAQQGELVRAATNYRKGIAQDRDNVELIEKYLGAATKMPVDTKRQARVTLGNIQSLKEQITEYHRSDQKALESYYQLLVELAHKLGPGFYGRLYDQADARLKSGDEDNLIARKFRGIAQTERLTPDLASEQINQAINDLKAARKTFPKDAQVLYHIALWKLKEAHRLDRPGGQPEKAAKLRKQAVQTAKAMYDVDPDSPKRAAKYVRILLNKKVDKLDDAKAVLANLEQALLKDPQPLYRVILAARALQRVDKEHGLARAHQLLAKAQKAHPQDLSYQVMLADTLRKQHKLGDAYQRLDQAAGASSNAPVFQWLRAETFKRQALYQMGRIALTKVHRAKEGETRSKWLDRAEQAANRLDDLTDQPTGQLSLLRGKIAFTKKQPGKALAAFQQANEIYQDQNLEVLLGIADSAEQLDQWGESVHRIKMVLNRRPDINPIRLRLISILLKRPNPDNLEAAQQNLDYVLADDPASKTALKLQARLYNQRGEFDKALAIYNNKLHLNKGSQLLGQRVRALLASGKTDQARGLVRKQFEANPTNIGLVQQLLRLTKNAKTQRKILAKASKAGADPKIIKVFENQAAGKKLDVKELAKLIGDKTKDPFAAAMTEAKLYARAGQAKQARAALQRAISLNPDSPRVIEVRFGLALTQKDFDQAEKLAEKAGKRNLDQAHGKFYQARLLAAKDQVPRAVATLRQGLKVRPVYSDGWRLLGKLLQRQGKHEDAIEALTKATTQRPDDIEAMRRLAASLAEAGHESRALQTIRKARADAPKNDQVFAQYVSMEQSLGDPGRALQARSTRAEKQPSDTNNRRSLAILLAKQDQPDQALTTVNKLIKDKGQTRANVATLAAVHRLGGKPEEGLSAINDYLTQRGNKARTEDELLKARYLGRIGRSEQMAQVYRQALAKAQAQSKTNASSGGGQPGQVDQVSKAQQVRREFAARMFNAGQLDVALALFKQLHQQNPDDLGLTLRLAQTMLSTGKTDQARDLLNGSPKAKGSVTGAVIRALAAGQHKDDQAALDILDKALNQANQASDSAKPNKLALATLHFQRGRILAGQSNHEQAINELRQAITLNPSLTQAKMLLAQNMMQTRRREAAISLLDRILDKHPDNQQARVQLLDAYAARNEFPQARNLLESAMKRFPDDARWPELRARLESQASRPRQALRYWREALDMQSKPQARTLSSLVNLQLNQGRANQALAVLEDHPSLIQAAPFIQALRARALANTGKRSEARQVFTHAIDRAQSQAQVSAVIGQVRRTYNDPTQALALFQAIDRASNATNTSDSSNQSNTRSPVAAREIGLALAQTQMQLGQFDQALGQLKKIRSRLPKNDPHSQVRVGRLIGMAYHRSGQLAKARSAYEQALQIEPDDVRTLNNLAFLLTAPMNQPAQGLPLAKRAAKNAPNNVQVLDTLGWTQYKLGKLDQARQTLRKALAIHPIDDTSYHLAKVEHDLAGQTDDRDQSRRLRADARDRLQRLVKNSAAPNNPARKTVVQTKAQTLLKQLTKKAAN